MPRKNKQTEQPFPVETGEPIIVADTRQDDISVAAYFRAEARGFGPGHELEDWLAAEQDVAGRQVGA